MLDVLKTYAQSFAGLMAWLSEIEAALLADPSADISLDPRPEVQGRSATMARQAVKQVDAAAWLLALADIRRQVRNLFIVWETDPDFDALKLRERIRALREAIYDGLGERKLLYVKDVDLYEKEQGFGAKVDGVFNDNFLRKDIAEAGKCLALDRNTAAVFHLMRVAEVGLRALARKLRAINSDVLFYIWDARQPNLPLIPTARPTNILTGISFPVRRWLDRFLKRLVKDLQINVADLFAQLVVFGALLFADRLVLLPTLLCGHACTLARPRKRGHSGCAGYPLHVSTIAAKASALCR